MNDLSSRVWHDMDSMEMLKQWADYRDSLSQICESMCAQCNADGDTGRAMTWVDETESQLLGFADAAHYLCGVSDQDWKDWRSYIIRTWRAEMYRNNIAVKKVRDN